jgi:hypothetical protein
MEACELQRAWAAPTLWPCWMKPTWPVFWAYSAYCLQLSSVDIPGSGYLQHPRVSFASLSFILKALQFPSQGLPADTPTLPHTAWPLGLFLKSGCKLAGPHNSNILYACKTSIIWMMPSSASSLSSSWAYLSHSCNGLWIPGQLNIKKQFSRQPRVTMVDQTS